MVSEFSGFGIFCFILICFKNEIKISNFLLFVFDLGEFAADILSTKDSMRLVKYLGRSLGFGRSYFFHLGRYVFCGVSSDYYNFLIEWITLHADYVFSSYYYRLQSYEGRDLILAPSIC